MEMQCTVTPDYEEPTMQAIVIQAVEDDCDEIDHETANGQWLRNEVISEEAGIKRTAHGEIIYGTLRATRFAQRDFTPWFITQGMLDIMDRDGDTYDVGCDMRAIKTQLQKAYDDDCGEAYANGVIITTSLRVNGYARGQNIGLAMLRHLKRLHLGVPFYYAAMTAALDHGRDDPMRAVATDAINRYYKSCPDLGLRAVAPRAHPHLLTAFWNTHRNPTETYDVDLSAMCARARKEMAVHQNA